MKTIKISFLLLLIILIAPSSFFARNQSETYLETRRLLFQMERSPANEALKKLFEEGDVRRDDLIKALYDNEERISLNAQSVIKYVAEPEALNALNKWYEYRKAQSKDYWISPVILATEVEYSIGEDKDVAELVRKNFHPDQKDISAKLVAYNERTKTALIEVTYGEILTNGWHTVVRQENGKWRLLSNYLVWQS